ncbi:hypothetical protein ACFQ1I_06435 [Kitasatospora arboriphila]
MVADLARLCDRFGSGLITFRLAALATDEIAGPGLAYGPELAAAARTLGIGVSVDAVFGAPPRGRSSTGGGRACSTNRCR